MFPQYAAVDKILTDSASRGPSSVEELLVTLILVMRAGDNRHRHLMLPCYLLTSQFDLVAVRELRLPLNYHDDDDAKVNSSSQIPVRAM